MPTPEVSKMLWALLDYGLSYKDVDDLYDLYKLNGTLNAETPIEVQKHYPTDIAGLIEGNGDLNPTYIRTLGEIRSDDRSEFMKKVSRVISDSKNPIGYILRKVTPAGITVNSFLRTLGIPTIEKKKKLPGRTRPAWQPDNKTRFIYHD